MLTVQQALQALPERTTTGVYRRSFTVRRSWRGSRVVLHIGGAELRQLAQVAAVE